MKEWKKDHHVYENYNAVTGEGADVRNSDGFYSWGGLLALIPLWNQATGIKPVKITIFILVTGCLETRSKQVIASHHRSLAYGK